jgi:hypothetical protein
MHEVSHLLLLSMVEAPGDHPLADGNLMHTARQLVLPAACDLLKAWQLSDRHGCPSQL